MTSLGRVRTFAVASLVLILGGTTYTGYANAREGAALAAQRALLASQATSLCIDSLVIADVVPIILAPKGSPAAAAALGHLRSDYQGRLRRCR